MQECKNIEIFKSVKNDLGAANFKRNKITQNSSIYYNKYRPLL